jgi:hypothetical protein
MPAITEMLEITVMMFTVMPCTTITVLMHLTATTVRTRAAS